MKCTVIKKAKVQISNGQCKLNGDFSINSFVSNIMINQSDQNCLKNSSISVAMNEKGKITKINIK